MTKAHHEPQRHRGRESIIEVTLVDIQPYLEKLYKECKKTGKIGDDVMEINVWSDNLGYIETTQGVFFLNYEAIPAGNDESPLTAHGNFHQMPVYFKKEGSIPMFPSAEVKITRELVLSLPVKGKVNFAKWVKTFGERLESNFNNWNDFLTPIYAAGDSDGDSLDKG
jgi:hypothetical protein